MNERGKIMKKFVLYALFELMMVNCIAFLAVGAYLGSGRGGRSCQRAPTVSRTNARLVGGRQWLPCCPDTTKT